MSISSKLLSTAIPTAFWIGRVITAQESGTPGINYRVTRVEVSSQPDMFDVYVEMIIAPPLKKQFSQATAKRYYDALCYLEGHLTDPALQQVIRSALHHDH